MLIIFITLKMVLVIVCLVNCYIKFILFSTHLLVLLHYHSWTLLLDVVPLDKLAMEPFVVFISYFYHLYHLGHHHKTSNKLGKHQIDSSLTTITQAYYALFVSLCCKSFVPYCNHHMMFISRSKLSHFYVSCEFQCSATWSSKDFGGSNSMGFCLILASPCRKHEVFLHIVKTLVGLPHCKHKNLHLSHSPNYAQF